MPLNNETNLNPSHAVYFIAQDLFATEFHITALETRERLQPNLN